MPKKILTVCHDAGAAEIISAYIKKNPNHDRFFCVALGPAKKIFERKGLGDLFVNDPERLPADVIASLGGLDFVLTGTSWSTNLDRNYIIAAKTVGISTAAYLDHWTNYRERFGYPAQGWEQNLPDEIWVGDEYAFKMAKSLGCFLNVKLEPNLYFDEMRAQIELVKNTLPNVGNNLNKKRVLFISEPVSTGAMKSYGNPSYFGYTEMDVLRDIIISLSDIRAVDCELRIRLHPSDLPGHYDDLASSVNIKSKVLYSDKVNLIEDIIQADVIVGMDSMALVTAMFADKPVVSYIPSQKKDCIIPFEQILRIKDRASLEAKMRIFLA